MSVFTKVIGGIITVIALVCFVSGNTVHAQTGKFGGNSRAIDTNAVFEFSSRNKGLLIPRVPLGSTSAAYPLGAHKAGMIVYNDSTANDVTPGFYYNNGTNWVRASDASDNDTLSGDSYIVVTTA